MIDIYRIVYQTIENAHSFQTPWSIYNNWPDVRLPKNSFKKSLKHKLHSPSSNYNVTKPDSKQ